MSSIPENNMVVVPSNTDLAPLDLDFGDEGELVVKPTLYSNPRLQWFNGLTTTSFETAIGFHIEADINPLLDETLGGMGVKRYVVQHKSPDKNGEVKQVPYWALSAGGRTCSLFILSYGIKSKNEMNRDVNDRCGIAYGWEVSRNHEGQIVMKKGSNEPKRQCRLQFRAYIHELVQHGFSEWFQVAFSGIITEDVLAALDVQFRVIDVYNAYARGQGTKSAPFCGFSLPLAPGAVKMVGPKDGDKSPIYPPVAQVPQQLSSEYLRAHLIPGELMQLIRENHVLEDAAAWSIQRSQEIIGEQSPTEQSQVATPTATVIVDAPPTPQPPAIPVVQAPPAAPQLPEADRRLTPKEVDWIRKGYCVNNPNFLKDVCNRFTVARAEDLMLSHYNQLKAESENYTQS